MNDDRWPNLRGTPRASFRLSCMNYTFGVCNLAVEVTVCDRWLRRRCITRARFGARLHFGVRRSWVGATKETRRILGLLLSTFNEKSMYRNGWCEVMLRIWYVAAFLEGFVFHTILVPTIKNREHIGSRRRRVENKRAIGYSSAAGERNANPRPSWRRFQSKITALSWVHCGRNSKIVDAIHDNRKWCSSIWDDNVSMRHSKV